MEKIYLAEPYTTEIEAKVAEIGPNGGIVFDQTIFYATSGGQPNDLGTISWNGTTVDVVDVKKFETDGIEVILAEN